jgi:hypothetical protein
MSQHDRYWVRPTLTELESRLTPSNSLVNGDIIIRGSDGNDHVTVDRVWIGGQAHIRVTENNVRTDYLASRVTGEVKFYGNLGNDTFICNAPIRVYAEGGPGDDFLQGGPLNDVLRGGSGNDTLRGGAGNDILYAGSGNDRLFGEAGNDQLYGEYGNNWLDAGSASEFVDLGVGNSYNAWVWAYDGTTATDIQQRHSNTCVFLSVLAGVANAGTVNLANQIRYLGNYNYAVRMLVNGGWTEVTVRFDGQLTQENGRTYDALSTTKGEFWPLLFQRAYMKTVEHDPYSAQSMASFGGEPSGYRALQTLTGRNPYIDLLTSYSPQQLRQLVSNRKVVDVGGTGHRYAVLDVYQSGSEWFVRLYNPWARDLTHDSRLAIIPDNRNDGVITVRWSSFTAAFKSISYLL